MVFHGIGAAGLVALFSGIALMMRFGVTFRNRIDFSGASLEPDDRRITPDLVRLHQNDLRGRCGVFLSGLGGILLISDLCRLACEL